MRLRSSKPSKHIGSLFFNPGGPGTPASEIILGQAFGLPFFTDTLSSYFDLIGLDPRGIGSSSPINCDAKIWNERVSYFPTTEREFEDLVAHNKALGESCLNLTGPLLGFMDTISVARDMEAVRLALGEGPLNYLGLSYGTQIGSQYAALYPNNIRVLALDGNVDHSQSETASLFIEASTYEDAFSRFAKWCSEASTCALHDKDVRALFRDLVEQANACPIPAPGCVASGTCRGNVTGEEILFNSQELLLLKNPLPTFGQLPFAQGWNGFGKAISEALAGNATLLATSLAMSNDGDPTFGGAAVQCLDWTHNSALTFSQLKYKQQLGAVVTPITRGACQTWEIQASCIGWPLPVTNPPRRLNATGLSAPVLMVNAEHDPSTSYVWANSLLEQIANATLLTRRGDGHTSYYLAGDTTKAIDAYLVNGTLPPPNTVLES